MDWGRSGGGVCVRMVVGDRGTRNVRVILRMEEREVSYSGKRPDTFLDPGGCKTRVVEEEDGVGVG